MKKENLLKITDLRHELHMYPELSMQEQETAERVKMFLRDNTHFRMKYLERQIVGFAEEEAKKVGLRTEWSIHDYFPETRNDARCLAAAISAASDLGMNVIRMKDMWRASEDFGWYLKECPGAIIYIGNGEDYSPLHTVEYDFNDRILEKAVDLFAALA